MSKNPPIEHIQSRIYFFRGHRVLLETDLALLYGLPVNRLLIPAQRFPGEFCFRLESLEVMNLGGEIKDPRHRPYVFTEHGALAMGYVLATPETIAMSAQIVRAFARLKQTAPHPRTLVSVGY